MAGVRAAFEFLPAPETAIPRFVTFADRLEEAGRAGIADVVVGERDVVDPGVGQAVDEPRVGREVWSPRRGSAGCSGAGFSKLAMAMSAPSMRSRTTPALPVRFVYGSVPAERRAVLAAAGDLGRPAIEREVGALAP